MLYLLKYLFLFATGSFMGWIIEVFFRRYFGGARRWINPGFLQGPYLPLYGFGILALYIISSLHIALYFRLLAAIIITTLFELIAGLILLYYYKMRLWDYRKNKWNYKGLICPRFSLYWGILSIFFYFVLYPHFYNEVDFLYNNLQFSLLVGIFYGAFFMDLGMSFHLSYRLKEAIQTINEKNFQLPLEELRLQVRDASKNLSLKRRLSPNFISSLKGVDLELEIRNRLKDYRNKKPNQ